MPPRQNDNQKTSHIHEDILSDCQLYKAPQTPSSDPEGPLHIFFWNQFDVICDEQQSEK